MDLMEGEVKYCGDEVLISSQDEVIMCFRSEMKKLRELEASEEEDRDVAKEVREHCEPKAAAESSLVKEGPIVQFCRITTMAHRKFEYEQFSDKTNIAIQNLKNDKFMKNVDNMVSMCEQNLLKSVRITIYYYRFSDSCKHFHGSPVVLNFTDSEYFVKCNAKDDRVFLGVERYEKQKLQRFPHSDQDCLPFLFYMKAKQDGSNHFESAMHTGWFMKAFCNKVEMGPLSPENESCYFLVE